MLVELHGRPMLDALHEGFPGFGRDGYNPVVAVLGVAYQDGLRFVVGDLDAGVLGSVAAGTPVRIFGHGGRLPSRRVSGQSAGSLRGSDLARLCRRPLTAAVERKP